MTPTELELYRYIEKNRPELFFDNDELLSFIQTRAADSRFKYELQTAIGISPSDAQEEAHRVLYENLSYQPCRIIEQIIEKNCGVTAQPSILVYCYRAVQHIFEEYPSTDEFVSSADYQRLSERIELPVMQIIGKWNLTDQLATGLGHVRMMTPKELELYRFIEENRPEMLLDGDDLYSFVQGRAADYWEEFETQLQSGIASVLAHEAAHRILYEDLNFCPCQLIRDVIEKNYQIAAHPTIVVSCYLAVKDIFEEYPSTDEFYLSAEYERLSERIEYPVIQYLRENDLENRIETGVQAG